MTNQTTETPAADVVLLSSICGQHHNAYCQSCKSARDCSDQEIRRLHDEINRLRAENAELQADKDALYKSYKEMKGAADDLQRKLDEEVKRAFYSGHLHGWMRGDSETAEEGFSLYLDLVSTCGEA